MRDYDYRVLSLLDLLLDILVGLPEKGYPEKDLEEAKKLAAKVREILALEGEDGDG